MNPNDAADRLEAILVAENAALERHDPETAIALLEHKLAAAEALCPDGLDREDGNRLKALAAENRRLLERAIDVQSRIVTMVARAAQTVPPVSRYGAEGRPVPADGALAITRQA